MAVFLTCDDTGEKRVQAEECSVICTVQNIHVLFIVDSKDYLQMEKIYNYFSTSKELLYCTVIYSN